MNGIEGSPEIGCALRVIRLEPAEIVAAPAGKNLLATEGKVMNERIRFALVVLYGGLSGLCITALCFLGYHRIPVPEALSAATGACLAAMITCVPPYSNRPD